jgi:hypothetical protein
LLVAAGCSGGGSGGGGGGGGNSAPVVDAGSNQSLALPQVLALQGSSSDDGLPSGQVTTAWSVQSGPGTVLFVDRFALSTLATVSEPGSYVLRLTADDGEFQAHDDVAFAVADLPGNEIALDANTRHQTITGWEATADAHQDLSPAWNSYKDELFDLAVDDLGITRVRLEVRSGVENDQDYWTMFRNGQISSTEWRSRRYSTVNDNGDPNVIDFSRFRFSELDSIVTKVVLPLRSRVLANGEPFHVNVCYVAFTCQIGASLGYDHLDANEYAEFAETTYRHLNDTYGFVPDSWEMILEPDNTLPSSPPCPTSSRWPWFAGTIGNAMAVLGPRLIASGFTPRFVAPSSSSMNTAVTQFDNLASIPNAVDHMVELSYHRYNGVTSDLQMIQARALAFGLDTAHLEHIGADYLQLHEDLKVGGNSAWAQYVLATLTSIVPDDGTAYYVLDDSNPSSPVIRMGSRTHYLRQYMKYVRPGSVRIEATTSNASFDPLAFVRLDGGRVTVVKALASGTFFVRDLPAGTYGICLTTQAQQGFDAPDAVLIPGEILTATIPAAGVITIYSKP